MGDVNSWRGVPIIELERQAFFSTIPHSVQPLSDGAALWNYKNCISTADDTECTTTVVFGVAKTQCSGGQADVICCNHQFFVRA